jgi:hypothetical protein
MVYKRVSPNRDYEEVDTRIHRDATTPGRSEIALREGFSLLNAHEKLTPGGMDDQENSMTSRGETPERRRAREGSYGSNHGLRKIAEALSATYVAAEGTDMLNGWRTAVYDPTKGAYTIDVTGTFKVQGIEVDSGVVAIVTAEQNVRSAANKYDNPTALRDAAKLVKKDIPARVSFKANTLAERLEAMSNDLLGE